MNKFLKLLLILISASIITSCTKDDDPKIEPLRDYVEQYAKDLDTIDKFIDTHYMTVDADYNVTYSLLPTDGSQQSIRQQTQYPLQFQIVQNDAQNVNYKVYYIKLREGVNDQPSEVDSVHVAYKGERIYTKQEEILPATTPKTYEYFLDNLQFDFAQNPIWFELQSVVPGWAEIIPKFKTGNYDEAEGPDPVLFQEYGAGVMFLPSGLGYYGNPAPGGTIPLYSNLIFNFKLMELRYRDHDRDGILSKDERDTNNPTKKLIDYDSDGDGFANFFDIDDDGDRVQTKFEIINQLTGLPYSYDAIPDCSGNTTNPARVRKHINPACQ